MDKNAVIKASTKLHRMRLAVETMRSASSFQATALAWEDFIMAAGTFYSKLEQGSKTNGQSKAWFGRKKNERKTDQLLQYIHQARNAEEHGIAEITQVYGNKIELRSKGSFVTLRSDGKQWNVVNEHGDVGWPDARITLVTVKDGRFGDSFDPPDQHLGRPVPDHSPLTVAEMSISYLEGVLEEAANLTD